MSNTQSTTPRPIAASNPRRPIDHKRIHGQLDEAESCLHGARRATLCQSLYVSEPQRCRIESHIREAEAYLAGAYSHTAELWEWSESQAQGAFPVAESRRLVAKAALGLLTCIRATERELADLSASVRGGK